MVPVLAIMPMSIGLISDHTISIGGWKKNILRFTSLLSLCRNIVAGGC